MLVLLLPPLAEGRLTDIDGYTRLLRVRDLNEHGRWYDPIESRANAPFGVVSHWTRPLDLLLLGGARGLAPWLGFDNALFVWGAVLSPCLYLLAAAVLASMSKALLSPQARLLMLLAFPLQLALLMDSAPGLPDHHALLILIEVVSVGMTVRMIVGPGERAQAMAAGALLALGLWVSIEFLLAAVLLVAGLGVGWLVHAGARAARNAYHALGLAVGLALAVLLERGPSTRLALEFDRLSVVHLGLAVASLLFWFAIAFATARHEWPTWARWLACTTAALPLAALLARIAGQALTEASLTGDPLTVDFYKAGAGFGSLWPLDAESTGRFLVYLGASLFAVPFMLGTARRERLAPDREKWLVVGLVTLGHVAGALFVARLAAYAELLLLIPLGAVMAAWLRYCHAQTRTWKRVLAASVGLPSLLLAPLAGGAFLIAWRPPPVAELDQDRPSDLSPLYPMLEQLGDRPLTIMSPARDAPELLYRTRHWTVAYPHHRGLGSVRDCLTFYHTPDESVARSIVRERSVDLLIVPRTPSSNSVQETAAEPFVQRIAGSCPGWLRRLRSEQADAAAVTMFAVVE